MHFAEKVRFDEDGKALITRIVRNGVAMNRTISAWIAGPDDDRFDILLQTNAPQRLEWHNIGVNETFGGKIALRWGATLLEIRMQSSLPNIEAIVHIAS